MAFCEKCGKEIGPSGVCDCQKENTAANSAAPAGKGNSKALIGIIAAVAVVLVIILIAVFAGGGSYKTPINKLVKMINKQSTDLMAYSELMTDPVSYNYQEALLNIRLKDKDTKEEYEDAKKELDDYYDDIKGFKITKCDIRSAEKMKKKELKEIAEQYYDDDDEDMYKDQIEDLNDYEKEDYEDLADNLDISVSDAKKYVKETINYYKALSKIKITEGYNVELRIYAKYDGEEDKTEIIKDIQVIKMNGKWYIRNAGTIFNGMTFDSEEFDEINMRELYNYIR
ncbi:MAG: hypothetical protein ACI4HQ_04690 [Acetatifactor sp.]